MKTIQPTVHYGHSLSTTALSYNQGKAPRGLFLKKVANILGEASLYVTVIFVMIAGLGLLYV